MTEVLKFSESFMPPVPQPPYVIADSLSTVAGDRLITAVFPRFWKLLQAEMRTHRMMSQSHYSSRAIPIDKTIEQVTNDPYIPLWTQYQKGMGGSDTLSETHKKQASIESMMLRLVAIDTVKDLKSIGVAKQEANRYLEPWMHGGVVCTANIQWWQHFFNLRCKEGVQPDFCIQATQLRDSIANSKPKLLKPGQWHLPFFDDKLDGYLLPQRLVICTARCARISYDNFEGDFSYGKDKSLHDRLIQDKHMTPLEHSAMCMPDNGSYCNFTGFKHYRHYIEDGYSLSRIHKLSLHMMR